jgi:hypothetical protein
VDARYQCFQRAPVAFIAEACREVRVDDFLRALLCCVCDAVEQAHSPLLRLATA